MTTHCSSTSRLRGVGAAVGAATLTCTAFAGGPVPYALNAGSFFEEGCYGPCLCPIYQGALSGTFTLTPIDITGTFDQYAVDDVEWTISFDGAPPKPVTGSGIFTRFSEFAVVQTLELDLMIDNEPVEAFSSGPVVVPGFEFPDINMTVTVNDFDCFDTVFGILASPAEAPPCTGDLDGDGTVGFFDLLAMIGAWGPCGSACPADLDLNGEVGFPDVLLLIGSWGPCGD